jgi:hypothetical protein
MFELSIAQIHAAYTALADIRVARVDMFGKFGFAKGRCISVGHADMARMFAPVSGASFLTVKYRSLRHLNQCST